MDSLAMVSVMLGVGMLVNALLLYAVTGAMKFVASNLAALWIVEKQNFAEIQYVANHLRELEKDETRKAA